MGISPAGVASLLAISPGKYPDAPVDCNGLITDLDCGELGSGLGSSGT